MQDGTALYSYACWFDACACVELAEARPDASACKDTSKQEQLLHRFCEGPVSLEACTRLPTASTVLAQTLLSKLGANAKSLLPLGGRSPTRTRPCSCCRACGARTRSPRSASRSPRERSGPLIIACYNSVVARATRRRRWKAPPLSASTPSKPRRHRRAFDASRAGEL